MKGSLRPYQVEDLSYLIANPRSGLLHEPGGGKTPIIATYLWYRWDTMKSRSIFVMPKQLLRKNVDEILRFTHFQPEEVVIVDKDLSVILSDAKVFLMGPDRLKLSGMDLLGVHPDIKTLAGDETHMMWQNDKSARTRALYQINNRMTSFVPLTGTLIKGKLSSAYPVFHCIEPRYYPSYQGFLNYHAVEDEFGNVCAWKNTDRIAEIVSKHFISRSFESIYGPEAKVIINEVADMRPDQRKAYDEFEARAILELEDGFLTGTTGGVHALRCRQIMSHPETFGLGSGTTGKDLLLDIHLDQHYQDGKRFVVFAPFIAEQKRILAQVRAKGITAALLNGSVSLPDRIAVDLAFRSGDIQCIVGSPIVAGVGYNWEVCDHIIYPTLDYGDDTFVQGYRRAIRGVRKTPLLITVLEYRDSLDQRIIKNITRKSKLANAVQATKEIYELGEKE